jgi:hypothetical protein
MRAERVKSWNPENLASWVSGDGVRIQYCGVMAECLGSGQLRTFASRLATTCGWPLYFWVRPESDIPGFTRKVLVAATQDAHVLQPILTLLATSGPSASYKNGDPEVAVNVAIDVLFFSSSCNY